MGIKKSGKAQRTIPIPIAISIPIYREPTWFTEYLPGFYHKSLYFLAIVLHVRHLGGANRCFGDCLRPMMLNPHISQTNGMILYKRLLCLLLQAHFATFENRTLYFSLGNDIILRCKLKNAPKRSTMVLSMSKKSTQCRFTAGKKRNWPGERQDFLKTRLPGCHGKK